MEITHTKYSTGFTLVEILVAMSIAAIIGILVSQVFFTTIRSNTKTELLKDVKQNGEYAIGVMERMIRNSLGVVSACSSAGTTLSSIVITNSNGDTTTFGCDFDNAADVARIASTSGSAGTEYLTSSNITIGGTACNDTDNSLTFVCTSSPDEPPSITVNFSLQKAGVQIDQTEQSTAAFSTTITARN